MGCDSVLPYSPSFLAWGGEKRGLCFFVPLSPFPSKSLVSLAMAPSTANRWIRPEVFPLFAAVGVAVGICGMQLIRNICTNPEVRVTKEKRAAGVLDNFAEGEKYSQHVVRRFVRNRPSQVMPSINNFFSDPK